MSLFQFFLDILFRTTIFFGICKPMHWNLGIGMEFEIGTDITTTIISSSIRPIDPKLSWGVDLGWGEPTHKATGHFDVVITWQIKNITFPFSQGLWTPNLAGWWLRMRGPHLQSHVTLQLWSSDKSKIFNLHFRKAQGRQT